MVMFKGVEYRKLDRERAAIELLGGDLSPYGYAILTNGKRVIYQYIENNRPRLLVLYTPPKRDVADMDDWLDRHVIGVYHPVGKRK